MSCTARVLACVPSLHTFHLNDCGAVPNCCVCVDSRSECLVIYAKPAEGRSGGEIIQCTVLFVSCYPHYIFVVRCIGQKVCLDSWQLISNFRVQMFCFVCGKCFLMRDNDSTGVRDQA